MATDGWDARAHSLNLGPLSHGSISRHLLSNRDNVEIPMLKYFNVQNLIG